MSSLFGNLNNNTKSDYGGLFSSTSKPATTTAGGGLFGGLNSSASTSQPANAPGMFSGLGLGGSSKPTTTNTSSPFGGLGQTSQASTTAAPTFGGTTTSGAPPGGSVFGPGPTINPTSQAPAGSSLFGASASTTQPAQQQNGQNTAYFDAILEKSRKRAHAESIADDLPQLQLGLGDLRQRIKRVGAGAQGQTADSRGHYLLRASGVNPGEAIRDLNQLNAAASRAERPQPQEPQDVDVETYLTNLQTQTTLSMISDGLSRSVRDFDAFLEDNVELEWDAQRKRIYSHFGIRPKETTVGKGSFAASVGESNGAFGRSRRSKAPGLTGSRLNGSPGGSTFGRSALQKSVIGAAGPVGAGHQPLFADVEKKMEASGVSVTGPHDRFQRDKESKYAERVQNLNFARLQRRPYPVCSEFADVVNLSPDQHGADLIKAYRALIEIVGEDPEAKEWSEERTARERKYAADYLGENPAATLSMKKRILRGGVRCLEKLAFEKMEDAVTRNPRDANVGGIPNVINKVKGYVRLQAGKKNLGGDNSDLQMLGGDFVWALIYFLLRTGHVAEALDYVEVNQVAFRAIDRNFQGYIRAYAQSDDRRLDENLQSRINSEYNQRLRIAPENSIDPYRMACYKIIGRCDLRQRFLEGIEQSFEDWAWVQLVLAREINRVDAMASEIFGLSEAQDTMREIGNRYFTKGSVEGNSFGVYVFLQLAYGMFEDCVSYLYTYNYVDGVHLAIALDFYGLLRVADPNSGSEDLLSLTTRGQSQINFGTMLGLYTRDFRAAAVSAAVDYLTLICLNNDLPGHAGKNQMMLCHEALRELVLESREFALLLGDMRNDGQRIRGVIEERMRLIGLDESGDFMRTITLQAASIADDNGRVTDAVLLYHLAGEYDSVITTINRALSEAIAVPIGQDPMRIEPLKAPAGVNPHGPQEGTESSLTSIDDPVRLADTMRRMYDVQAMFSSRVKATNWEANRALLNMTIAKSQVERADFAGALDEIRRLAILPLEANGNPSLIRDCATKFSSLPQSVAQNVPNLLMWAIHCAEQQRRALMNTQFGGNEGTRLAMIEELKQMNMDLMTYTSQLSHAINTPPSQHVLQQQKRDFSEEATTSPGGGPASTSSDQSKKRRTTGGGASSSSRGVANLTPDQLAKKRANDREAQRAIRERTKNQIENLERKIRELTSQQPYQELQHVLKQKEAVEAENLDIKKRLDSVLQLIQPILGQHGLEIPTYTPPAQPYVPNRPSSASMNVSTPNGAASPAATSPWQTPNAPMAMGHDPRTYPQTHVLQTQQLAKQRHDMVHNLDMGPERLGLEFLLDSTQRINKIPNGINGVQETYQQNPRESPNSPTHHRRNSMGSHASYSASTPGGEMAGYSAPIRNGPPTCPLDSLLLDFLHKKQQEGADGTPTPTLVGPAYPSVSSLLNPARAATSHPISKFFTDILATFPDLSTLPEKVAVLYLMFLLMRWQISPTQENYDRLPEWATPRPSQLFTPHPAWVDHLPFPKMRDRLVANYNPRDYLFDNFFIPFTTTLSLNWPYEPTDTLLSSNEANGNGAGEELVINPVFERHLRNLENWSLGPAFAKAFPGLQDTYRLKIDGDRR
ncbi:hypothetical protein EG329_008354 [Mollisiaceae sp. DMI_Dod_QoI]|nr:hypothetical protein EG329_008354 [Helotiales sp. DMI_Dod_QoI]